MICMATLTGAARVAVGTYVAIAWYDQLFNCDEKLQPLGASSRR